MSISQDGAIAFAGTSPTRPAELYYMASPTAPVRRLTTVNDEIASIPLGKSEVVTFTNDKFAQNAILTYPPDFDPAKKYPMVLLIHGGPRAASMMTFSAGAQLMAAKGWLVLQPNYRGSDNLGRQFQAAIGNDAGAGPGRDVMAARRGRQGQGLRGRDATRRVGLVVRRLHDDVDARQLPGRLEGRRRRRGGDRSDRSAELQRRRAAAARGNNSPWLNAQAMERERAQSPMTYAGKIKAPTLILANTGDYRVPITQSYKLFHALRDAGVTLDVHRVSDRRPQRDRSGAPARRAGAMDRLARAIPE